MSLASKSLKLLFQIAFVVFAFLFRSEIKELITKDSLPTAFRKVVSQAIRSVIKIGQSAFPKQDKYVELKETLKKLDLKRNFASESSGARVVAKSKYIKHSNALIGKDKYNTGILFDCNLLETSPAYVIIDLIEDFYFEEFLLISKSVYTNLVKDFRLSSSLDLATDQWIEVGRFRNDPSRLFIQSKVRKNVLTRYIKIEFLSAYEDFKEFYCSVSELHVFGQTMTSFAQRRNEQLLREAENSSNLVETQLTGAPASTLPATVPTVNERRSAQEIASYLETCPAAHHRSLFLRTSPKQQPEKFVDPYFEMYDYLFSNIKDLKLNVNSLLKSVLKEKQGLSASDPLRSYLQTFIKDRNQILKRLRTLEEKVDHLRDKNRKLNSVLLLELKTHRLEAWIHKLVESKRRRNNEFEQRIRELTIKLEATKKDQTFFFTVFLVVLGLVCVVGASFYMLLRKRVEKGKK